ncbi:hypothetical protein P3342_013087 [Pyrenophora teres f. teres]|uniref:C3H1-type domain-containing protein n=2 Tax=Pyrenophora teres f. teres TaxID=97479 RepID=E3RSI5_PYRTT|nr:hypothetical protein PTT_11874 [Pyrenophora teres f. teres 0-1]KAE8826694.1 hypothetical protein HRS9139_07866 [Pyrenophora teres f. teres]KAE8832211.1 hypothetical protein PTNB85_06603 [Pyrenophora teres f. teres]KAE8837180.1 hypothetical protein HRS9122_07335 [Pyrenophora teres f. teres]KAE8855873.1 hypothetical protein PTNB29_08712 [Pyrenophora teres f. teres]
MDGYKGSESFAHVPSSPYSHNGSISRSSTCPSLPTYEESVETPRKRKAQDVPDVDSDEDFREEDDRSLNRWKAAYHKAMKYGREKKSNYLQLKGQLLEKDKQVDKANAVLHKRNGTVIELQAQVTNLKLKVNNCEKTIHELENELHDLKIAKKQSMQKHLNETMASSPTERRPHIPTHVPHDSTATREHPRYKHSEAPRKNVKVDFQRLIPSLHYPTGTGKVGPGHYGSNAYWDLGLCQVHFRTPGVCVHGERCEYRHTPLDVDERQYIRFFEKRGPAFLASTDAFLAAKRSVA